MTKQDKSEALKALYEELPYPPREPEDERVRLVRTGLDYLPKLSHYCFSGKLCLDEPRRILVAGGGTGDSAIYLGEQTKQSNVTIDYIDVSERSLEIARQRARIRGLENITFTLGSILDVATLFDHSFDYINCSGVLHHLPDPDAGLTALGQALKPHGAIGVMVYAQYGRTAVYQIQDLLQHIAGDEPLSRQVELARIVLDQLPETHWLNRSNDLHSDHVKLGDAGLADLFLNPSDRAYTVPQLHEWVRRSGLQFIDYASHKAHYQLENYISDESLLSVTAKKTKEEQQAIAELMSGTLIKHSFYAARQLPEPVSPTKKAIPVAAQDVDVEKIARQIGAQRQGGVVQLQTHDSRLSLPVNPISKGFFDHLNTTNTLAAMTEKISQQAVVRSMPPAWIERQVADLCELLISVDMLYLNHFPVATGRSAS